MKGSNSMRLALCLLTLSAVLSSTEARAASTDMCACVCQTAQGGWLWTARGPYWKFRQVTATAECAGLIGQSCATAGGKGKFLACEIMPEAVIDILNLLLKN